MYKIDDIVTFLPLQIEVVTKHLFSCYNLIFTIKFNIVFDIMNIQLKNNMIYFSSTFCIGVTFASHV